MNGDVRVVDDVPQSFAALVAAEGAHSLALSGGDTARRCYESLAGLGLDWSGTDVWFGDERWVPVDDDESNEGMIRRALLDRAVPRAVHSLRQAGSTAEAAADAYDRALREHDPIGLVHLGLGPDGHTASLFPGSAALRDERERLVVTTGDALHPHVRLTFTYPALVRARLVVFTVEGDSKRAAFARVRAGDDVPAAAVTADRVVWLVDPAAAGDPHEYTTGAG